MLCIRNTSDNEGEQLTSAWSLKRLAPKKTPNELLMTGPSMSCLKQ